MPPQKGQRQARGIARQQEILDAAFRLFAANGYRSTSLAMVAADVGITEAGVLHHYASKDALITAVLDARDHPAPALEAHATTVARRSAVAALRTLPESARVLVQRPELARFDIVVGGEALADGGSAASHFAARRHVIRTQFAELLRAGIRQGELRRGLDVTEVAAQIVAFMDGIQLQWLLDPKATDLVAAYRAYVNQLLRAITRPAR